MIGDYFLFVVSFYFTDLSYFLFVVSEVGPVRLLMRWKMPRRRRTSPSNASVASTTCSCYVLFKKCTTSRPPLSH